MSVNPIQTNSSPGTSLFYTPNGIPQIFTSTFTFGAGSGLAVGSSNYSTITVPGMVSTSGVALTYEHPNGGGAGQFIFSLAPGTNNLNVVFGAVTGAGETFNLISVNPK
jgi:hypothetical protein